MVVREGGLRAGVQPQATRRDRYAFHEHAEINQGAEAQPAVPGQDQANWSTEEAEVLVRSARRAGGPPDRGRGRLTDQAVAAGNVGTFRLRMRRP